MIRKMIRKTFALFSNEPKKKPKKAKLIINSFATQQKKNKVKQTPAPALLPFSGKQKDRSLLESVPEHLKGDVILFDRVLYVTKERAIKAQFLSYESMLKKTYKLDSTKIISVRELLMMQKKQQVVFAKQQNLKEATPAEAEANAFKLFDDARKLGASDIHIRVYQDMATIMVRVCGDLQELGQMHEKQANAICRAIYQSMADAKAADSTYLPDDYQDGRISNTKYLPPGLHGIRIASGPHVDGVLMVLRMLYADNDFVKQHKKGSKGTDLGDRLRHLGYSEQHIKLISIMFSRPTGINIIAGPTGSGKSTTLMHCMEAIAEGRPDKHLLTVEDPPEYPIKGCIQRPVKNAGSEKERRIAFNKAMRAALRSDPDVLMVGEIRDQTTALTAIEAAMTGHQVVSTLHANSAFNILTRMAGLLVSNEIPNPYDVLADNTIMTGLIFQRLVKDLCPKCKIPLIEYPQYLFEKMNEAFCPECRRYLSIHKDEDSLLEPLYLKFSESEKLCKQCQKNLNEIDIFPLSVIMRVSKIVDMTDKDSLGSQVSVKGDGCKACNYSGIKGRTVVAEVVCPDPDMLKELKVNGLEAARRYWINKQNGKPISDHVISKVKMGICDPLMAEDVIGPLTTSLVMDDNIFQEDEIDILMGIERKEN